MEREKEIEEMAQVMCENCAKTGSPCDLDIPTKMCDAVLEQAESIYNAGYRKQSEGELTKAHIEAHYEAICALADMVCQFGYSTTFRKKDAVCDGGLSALEYAFCALQDCGCKTNSNGTITLKNLWAFQEEFEAKMKGGGYL